MLGRHLLRFTAAEYKPLSEYIPSDIPDSYYVVVSDDELLIRKSFSMELPPAKYFLLDVVVVETLVGMETVAGIMFVVVGVVVRLR